MEFLTERDGGKGQESARRHFAIHVVLLAVAAVSFGVTGETADVVTLRTTNAVVTVERTGARVLRYVVDGKDVLWHCGLDAAGRWPSRYGGIPVCWPWFGSCGPDPRFKHGFLSRLPFSVVRRSEAADRAELVLKARSSGAKDGYPDHLADLEVRIALDRGLSVRLVTVNRGTADLRFTAGFHPYFAVTDPSRTTVDGFDGVPVCDARKNHLFERVWKGPLRYGQALDHVFDEKVHPIRHTITDEVDRRQILVESAGTTRTVAWFMEDGRRFVCLEPTICWQDHAVALAPGGSHEIALRLLPRLRKEE